MLDIAACSCYLLAMTKPIHHTCAKCGKSFNGNRHRKYCGRDCARADRGPSWNSGVKTGPNGRSTKVAKTCAGCGKTFSVSAYRADSAIFCTMSCYHAHRWDGVQSSNRECASCGKTFSQFACEDRKFCSHPCYVASGNGAFSGPDSPQWKGGTSKHYRRGADWPASSEAARVRDDRTCKGCGKPESALAGIRKRLDVHHIVPWSVGQSNAISNLVTLCRSCHHRSEPRPDVVKWLMACPTHQESFLAEARAAWGLE